MPLVPTVSARAFRMLLDHVRSYGVDPHRVMPPERLGSIDIDDDDARLPITRLRGFFGRAVEHTGDPHFGLHAAESADESSLGVFSFLVVTSPTWRVAMERVCRYQKLMDTGSRYRMQIDGSTARYLVRTFAPEEDRRHLVEFSVAICLYYSRRFVATDWTAREVFFSHRAPADDAEHRRVFGTDVRFEAPRSGFSFDAALLETPMTRGDVALSATLEKYAEQLHAKVPAEDDIADAVRARITNVLPGGDASLTAVAESLGVTSRTLQRRLREHGTSHQEILDEVRHLVAAELLAKPELAIAEVAFLLGFSGSAAFNRAFKRWAGQTPGAFRKAALGSQRA